MNKVLIKLYVPTLGENYDIYIPVNEMVWKVNRLIVKLISDMSNDNFSIDKDYALINIDTGMIYNNNDIIINTDIRNASRLLLVEI
ncbi:MAG: hypothetical protein L6V91_07605 [Bacilli bacterium]|nr:MAG: hypothetical protein L6V91_07605 [Bacilli bacterium]